MSANMFSPTGGYRFCARYALFATFVIASGSLLGQGADTRANWPKIPVSETLTYMDDTTHVTMWGKPEKDRFLRRVYLVMFKASSSGDSVRAVISAVHGKIAHGSVNDASYILTLPDPGPSASDIDRTLAAFRKHAAVQYVTPYPVGGVVNTIGGQKKP